jgi:hypothetical protein
MRNASLRIGLDFLERAEVQRRIADGRGPGTR